MDEPTELGAPPSIDPVEARAAEARLLTRLLPRGADAAVRIGRYRVLDKLGKGAHGVVYSAYDPQLDRRVAIKLLGRTEGAADRILQEARMLAQLSHPNIVSVFEVGAHEGDVFVAMEYVQGSTLGQWLSGEPRTPVQIVEVIAHAAEGLAHAHEHGIVHRDFKPANVMIDEGGRVRVMDFGLARVSDRMLETSHDESPPEPDGTWSSGTPAYMAPEQHRGEALDGRSDQYALCLTAWEALLGSHPFAESFGCAALAFALHEAKLDGPPRLPASSTRGLHRRQVQALRRGLCADPDDRWPNAGALARALRPKPLPVARVMVGMFAAGVAVAAVPLLVDTDPCADADKGFSSSWNDETRVSVLRAVEAAVSVPSQATLERLPLRIDNYAQQWAEAAQSVCVSNVAPAIEQARTRCLEVEQARFDATIELLRESDADVAQRAHELILGLPDPRQCEDPETTLSHVDEGADVLEIRRRLAVASARTKAGRYIEASQMLSALEGDVERSKSSAVIAEYQVERADMFRAQGQPEAAHRSGLIAIEHAAASERWDLLAAATTTLSYVLSEQLGRPGEGLEYARIGLRVSQGHGVDVGIALVAHLHHASALAAAGDPEAAATEYEETARLSRDAGRHLTEAAALADGAWVAIELGRTNDAIAAMARALEIGWDVRGFDHPEDAVTRLNLGTLLARQGRETEAEPELLRARRIFVDAYGPSHEDVARVDQALGNLYLGRNEFKEALARFRAAHALRKDVDGPRARLKVETLVAMASTLVKLDRHDEAFPFFEEAMAASADHPKSHANTRRWFAAALVDVGRDEEAGEHFRLAYEAMAQMQPGGRSATLYARAYGRYLVRRDEFEAAAEVLATVWPRIRDDAGYTRSLQGEVAWLVAQIDSEQGRDCDAHALASEALERFEGDPHSTGTSKIRDWLAEHPRPNGC